MKSSFSAAPRQVALIFTVLLMWNTGTHAQFTSYITPIDAPSVAMGESFVAVEGNLNAFVYNPAGLARLRGANIAYAFRPQDWFTLEGNMRQWQASATLESPIAVFGFSYSRFNFGDFVRTNSSGLVIGTFSSYEHTFSLAAATAFDCGISVGAAIKTWNFVNLPITSVGNPEGSIENDKTLPMVFDLGINHTSTFGDAGTKQTMTVGTSIQNFGSNFKATDRLTGYTASTQLARFFRAGVAHTFALDETKEELTPLRTLATIEYRKHLNGFTSAASDYYGFGIEVTILELASLRGGGYLSETAFFGYRGRLALRYGFGLSIPFQKLGTSIPIRLQGDYAAVPADPGGALFVRSTVHQYSIAVHYTNDVF